MRLALDARMHSVYREPISILIFSCPCASLRKVHRPPPPPQTSPITASPQPIAFGSSPFPILVPPGCVSCSEVSSFGPDCSRRPLLAIQRVPWARLWGGHRLRFSLGDITVRPYPSDSHLSRLWVRLLLHFRPSVRRSGFESRYLNLLFIISQISNKF